MTDYETIARQRLGLKTVGWPVRQAVRIWERIVFATQLLAVVACVWAVAALVFSFR